MLRSLVAPQPGRRRLAVGALGALLALGAGGSAALAQAPADEGTTGPGGASGDRPVTATSGNPATGTTPSSQPVTPTSTATTTITATPPPARATTRASVNLRVTPGAGKVIQRLPNKAVVDVLCHRVSAVYSSPTGASRVWDRVVRTDGTKGWTADGYLTTGSDGLVAPLCGAPAVPPPIVPGATEGACGILAPVSVLPPFATIGAFIKAAVPGAQASEAEDRVPASVTLAQGILETGGGRFTALANNYFGLKAQPVSAGVWTFGDHAVGCVLKKTLEQEGRGLVRTIQAFRAYDSLDDSILDHGERLATNPVYAPAFAYTHDRTRFAQEIAKHYATDSSYASKLLDLISRYKLGQYDAD